MRPSLAVPSALLALLLAAAAAGAEDTCVSCHRGQKEERLSRPVALTERDIHFRLRITCTACHGGDGVAAGKEAAHAPAAGFKGAPRGAAAIQTCGRCHSDASYMKDFNPGIRTDQVALYLESHHGKRMTEGDGKAATCVSCHGNHGILEVKDPASPVYPVNVPKTCGQCHGDAKYMEGRKIPTDIVAKYVGSVHGKALLERGDLAAPACNSCHGNHGATPPNITSVANVCGTCHAQQAEFFRASPKKEIFDSNDLPECVLCHSQHDIKPPTDSMLGVGKDSVCLDCHTDDSDTGWVAMKEMEDGLRTLVTRIGSAEEVLARAEHAGMEVSEPLFSMSEARDHLTEARVLLHTFDKGRIMAKVRAAEVIATQARGDGEQALEEINYRKKGLYVSLVAIAFLALGLWLKIRDLDARTAAPPPGPPAA